MKPLLIIDGHNLLWRAWHAVNRDPDNPNIDAGVAAFTNMCKHLVREYDTWAHVATFDVGVSQWRQHLAPHYKQQRSRYPQGFAVYTDRAIHQLKPEWTIVTDNYKEADDTIANLVRSHCAETNQPVIVVSNDQDMYQLINSQVTVERPTSGVKLRQTCNMAWLTDTYNLTGAQYLEAKAIAGDPSDNLTGVPGIGIKTAALWIAEHGTLEGVVTAVHAGTIKGKRADAYLSHYETVIINKQVMELDPADIATAPGGNSEPSARN